MSEYLKLTHDESTYVFDEYEIEDCLKALINIKSVILDNNYVFNQQNQEEMITYFREVFDMLPCLIPGDDIKHGVVGYLVTWQEPNDEGYNSSLESRFTTREEALAFHSNIYTRTMRFSHVYPIVSCCDEEFYCSGFTNTCEHCGWDYNFNGELLAPRSQWED